MKWTTADSYRQAFCGGGEELSPEGKDVMTDLMNYANFLDDKMGDNEAVRKLGQRDVVNRIIGMLNWDETKIVMSKGNK